MLRGQEQNGCVVYTYDLVLWELGANYISVSKNFDQIYIEFVTWFSTL